MAKCVPKFRRFCWPWRASQLSPFRYYYIKLIHTWTFHGRRWNQISRSFFLKKFQNDRRTFSSALIHLQTLTVRSRSTMEWPSPAGPSVAWRASLASAALLPNDRLPGKNLKKMISTISNWTNYHEISLSGWGAGFASAPWWAFWPLSARPDRRPWRPSNRPKSVPKISIIPALL